MTPNTSFLRYKYSSVSISPRHLNCLASPIAKNKYDWGQNLRKSRVTLTTPIMGHFVIPRVTLNIFYPNIKFGDSRFSRSEDMIAGVDMKNGSCVPDHAPFRGLWSSMCWGLI